MINYLWFKINSKLCFDPTPFHLPDQFLDLTSLNCWGIYFIKTLIGNKVLPRFDIELVQLYSYI